MRFRSFCFYVLYDFDINTISCGTTACYRDAIASTRADRPRRRQDRRLGLGRLGLGHPGLGHPGYSRLHRVQMVGGRPANSGHLDRLAVDQFHRGTIPDLRQSRSRIYLARPVPATFVAVSALRQILDVL